MTTVVFDGFTLAADMRGSIDETKHDCIHCGKLTVKHDDKNDKIIIPKNDVYFEKEKILAITISGKALYLTAIRKLIVKCNDFSFITDSIISLINPSDVMSLHIFLLLENTFTVINFNGRRNKVSTDTYPINDETFFSMGSGKPYAFVARQEMNMNAVEAIEFASKYDPATSKATTKFVYKERPKTAIVKPKRKAKK